MRLASNRGMMSLTKTKVRAAAISVSKVDMSSSVANWLLMNLELNEHMAVKLNWSSGSMVMTDPVFSSFTSILWRMT